jgi:hypothetical protein
MKHETTGEHTYGRAVWERQWEAGAWRCLWQVHEAQEHFLS